MKVLIVMNATEVKLGGGIIQVILNYKEQLENEDVFMTFAINSKKDSNISVILKGKNSNFIQLPNKKKNFLKYCIELYKIMHSSDFDVVHVHGSSANMVLELVIAKLNKIKIRIAHSHNSTCNHPKFNRILIPLLRHAYTKALACSELAGEWLFGKDNFSVLNNAIDLEKFKFSKEIRNEYRKKLEVNDNTVVIGHVGNINEQKNHEFLIKLFKLYNEKNSNSLLLLIGDGYLKEKMHNLVEELGIKENVKFLGIRNDVNNWMQAMDIFIFPSRWEGLGMVLIEAQASGLPVIASNVVPKTVKIQNNITFLDLNQNTCQDWIIEIDRLLESTANRLIDNRTFIDYDIKMQGKKLLEYYEDK